MPARTRDELGKALGSVLYEMLMLLVALSVNRRRFQHPYYEGLTWGDPQIAIEVILLKCRSLMDFIAPRRRVQDEITISDFGKSPVELPEDVQVFRRSVNQWSAHLSWHRVLRLPGSAPQPLQADLEKHSLWLLSKVNAIVCVSISEGVLLIEEHQQFLPVFQREYAKILADTQSSLINGSHQWQ